MKNQLKLKMDLAKDKEIWFDDTKLTLDQIKSPTRTSFTVHGKWAVIKGELTCDGWVVLEGISLQARVKLADLNDHGTCFVAIEVPRNMRVLRGTTRAEISNA